MVTGSIGDRVGGGRVLFLRTHVCSHPWSPYDSSRIGVLVQDLIEGPEQRSATDAGFAEFAWYLIEVRGSLLESPSAICRLSPLIAPPQASEGGWDENMEGAVRNGVLLWMDLPL